MKKYNNNKTKYKQYNKNYKKIPNKYYSEIEYRKKITKTRIFWVKVIIYVIILGFLNNINTIDLDKIGEENLYKNTEKVINLENSSKIKGYNFYSKNVFIYEKNTNTFYNIKGNINDNIVPASITKLATILYLLENNTNLNEVIKSGSEVNLVGSNESTANIKIGAENSVKNLIKMMLLPSANDATYTIAKNHLNKNKISYTNDQEMLEKFSNLMNEYFKVNYITGVNITNPSGIKESTSFSKSSLVKIVKRLLKYEEVVEFSKKDIEIINNIKYENTNKFLHQQSIWYNKNVVGLKTGSLTNNKNIVTIYNKNGNENNQYIIFTMGSKEEDNRYSDNKKVMEMIENEVLNSKS